MYRIFDIVFAEGIEAIFRFSLALMRRNEDKLLALDFEGILKFLGNEVFDCYKVGARGYGCDDVWALIDDPRLTRRLQPWPENPHLVKKKTPNGSPTTLSGMLMQRKCKLSGKLHGPSFD